MAKFKIGTLLLLFIWSELLFAQTASEALQYSLTRSVATARFNGIGGAMGALGGDFGAIGINPAGLGLFRKSDFYISMGPAYFQNNSILKGTGNEHYDESKTSFNFNGLGLVITNEPIGSNWKNLSFSLQIAKVADFNQNTYFKGKSPGSITDRFLELSLDPTQSGLIGLDPNDLDDFEAGLAYETGALFDPVGNPNQTVYTTDLLAYAGTAIPKEQLLKTRGSLYDFSIGFGGNYKEKLALGAVINIPTGNFKRNNTYKEYESTRDEFLPFIDLEFKEKLETEISGVNARLGLIYKPIQALRFGVAWQSPGVLCLKDKFNTELSYTYYNGRRDTSLTAYSPDGEFNYRLRTPMQWVLSIAAIGTYGFLSADIDFVDPSTAKYNLTSDSDNPSDYEYEKQLNSDIKKQYKSSIQYRFGGELALSKYRFRAGYELIQQAYKNVDEYNPGYSVGLGYRGNRSYLDFSFRRTNFNQSYAPYSTGNSDFDGNGTIDAPTPLVNQESFYQAFTITFGFKFGAIRSYSYED